MTIPERMGTEDFFEPKNSLKYLLYNFSPQQKIESRSSAFNGTSLSPIF